MIPSSKNRRFRSACNALFEPVEQRQMFAAFTVTNVNDGGAGSLRQAILDANTHSNLVETDLIEFAIASAGVHTIEPLTELPAITDPVFINGYSQNGSSA